MEGGSIQLSCEGSGYPTPTITWEKMGRPLRSENNVFINSGTGQLTIRDVTSSDTGTYSCVVANSEEKIETSTSVHVVPKGRKVMQTLHMKTIIMCIMWTFQLASYMLDINYPPPKIWLCPSGCSSICPPVRMSVRHKLVVAISQRLFQICTWNFRGVYISLRRSALHNNHNPPLLELLPFVIFHTWILCGTYLSGYKRYQHETV